MSWTDQVYKNNYKPAKQMVRPLLKVASLPAQRNFKNLSDCKGLSFKMLSTIFSADKSSSLFEVEN